MNIRTAVAVATLSCLPVAAQAQDWDGFYGGLEAGVAKSSSGFTTDRKSNFGAYAGYNFDLGPTVGGVELGYSNPKMTLSSGGVVEHQLKLKGRYGAKIGASGLGYGTVGYHRSKISSGGNASGYLFGVGYEHKLTENVSLGAELARYRYNNVDGSGKAASNNLSLRVGFGF